MKPYQILCVGVILTQALSAWGASPVTNDLWDISQGTVILDHSSFDHEVNQGYDARDVFGGSFTMQPGESGDVVFDDTSPSNIIDFIEWRTSAPVTVGSFNLFYRSDPPPFDATRRCLSHFSLFERASASDPWISIYSADTQLTGTQLTGLVSTFAATDFRAEFTRASTNEAQYTGERIIELDAFAVPEPGALALLGFPIVAILLRRQQR